MFNAKHIIGKFMGKRNYEARSTSVRKFRSAAFFCGEHIKLVQIWWIWDMAGWYENNLE